ncbi:hypothetical protein G5V57_17645 [Nordella sp. HKS 07]|uniref:hypothetical protein n=1 Tax=Nordella sp. HKS 07 TaxID=2712222 RepID=UPI0013E0F335|nr:hypothetical protein [Nordella sp. HKS 07]QIG49381.1 hypothetical protein G5V57_17645 [Nordella sp. HKS 07]
MAMNRAPLRNVRIGLILAAILLPVRLLSAAELEEGAAISAKEVLGEAASGANYHVQDPVTTDGLLRIYTLETNYGTYTIYGDAMLLQRRKELAALAALEKQSQSEAFGDALLKAGAAPVEFAGDLINKPKATIKRTISGIGELFDRVGSGLANVGKSSAGSTVNAALGVSVAKRQIASDLGVDPYTDFAPLAQQLDDFAKATAFGGLAMKIGFVFIPGTVGTAISATSSAQGLGSLVRDKTPAQLVDINRARLGKLGVPRANAAKFLSNSFYTPADQTVIVGALRRLQGVKDLGSYVERLAEANSRDLAIFLRTRTEMLAAYQQRTGAIVRIVNIEGIPLTRQKDGSIMFLGPVDSLTWNERVSKVFTVVTSAIRENDPNAALVLAISGTATPLSKTELEKLGWSMTALP